MCLMDLQQYIYQKCLYVLFNRLFIGALDVLDCVCEAAKHEMYGLVLIM